MLVALSEVEPSCGMGMAAGAWLKPGSLWRAGVRGQWQLGTAVSTREATQVRAARLFETEKDIFIPAAKTLFYFGFSQQLFIQNIWEKS